MNSKWVRAHYWVVCYRNNNHNPSNHWNPDDQDRALFDHYARAINETGTNFELLTDLNYKHLVLGWTWRVWGIAKKRNKWVITHRPTGRAVSHNPKQQTRRLRDSKALVEIIDGLSDCWHRPFVIGEKIRYTQKEKHDIQAFSQILNDYVKGANKR